MASEADVKLLFGAHEGSLGQITSDIEKMLASIDREKFKVVIGADLSEANTAIDGLRERVNALTKDLGSVMSASSFNIAAPSFDGVIDSVSRLTDSLRNMGGSGALNETNSALERTRSTLKEIETIEANISAQGNSTIYNDLLSKGVSAGLASNIERDFQNLSGTIQKVNADILQVADSEEMVAKVTATCADGIGNSFKVATTYVRDLNEAQKDVWKTAGNMTTTKTSAVVDIAKQQKAAYEEAKAAIKEYYDMLNRLTTKGTDVTQDATGRWYSPSAVSGTSHGWAEYADAMNRASDALSHHIDMMNQGAMSSRQVEELNQLIINSEHNRALALEERANKEEAAAEAEERSNAAARANAELKQQATAVYRDGADAIERWRDAQNSSSEAARQAYDALQQNVAALKTAIANYDGSEASSKRLADAQAAVQNSIRETGTVMQQSGAAAVTFGQKMTSALNSIKTMFGVTRIVWKIYAELKKMVQASIEVDSAMNTMQVVTGATKRELAEFGETAMKTAKELGAGVTDIINSATTYARLGYDTAESAILSKYTAMLQKVGDIDASAATDAVTAVIKAYDVDVDSIEEIMDRLVKVGNNFPISVSQIAEGMNNASSALSAAGNTFDQSVAMLTAANTTVQDANKASTGLRTIAARLRNTTAELDELGETMTTAKYEGLVSMLTKNGVSLRDANNEFKSTYVILRDLSEAWKTLKDDERAALATAVAGVRQQNVFTSIMENFDEASKAMDAMADSAGTLDDAYATHMDSAQAHVDQFKASLTELGSHLFDSESLKFIVDLGKGLIEVIGLVAKLIDKIGGLRTVLFAIVGMKLVSNADLIFKTLSKLPNLFSNLGAKAFSSFARIVTGASSAQIAMTGIVTAIGLVIAAYTLWQQHLQKVHEQNKKIINDSKESVNDTKELYDAYQGYQNAKSAIDDNIESKEALTEATKKLANALGLEGDAADTAKEKIEGLTKAELQKTYDDALEAKAAAERNLADLSWDAGLTMFSNKFMTLSSMYNLSGRNSPDFQKEIGYEDYSKRWALANETEKAKILLEIYNDLIKREQEFVDESKKTDDPTSFLNNSTDYKMITGLIGFLGDSVSAYKDAIEDVDNAQAMLDGTFNETADNAVANASRFEIASKIAQNAIAEAGDITDKEASKIERRIHDAEGAIDEADLSVAARLMERGEFDSWESLKEAIEAYKGSVEETADKVQDKLKLLWNSDEFADTKKEIIEMSKAVGGITAKNVEELAGKSEVLAEVLKTDGMNAQFLAEVLQTVGEGADGFELITGTALELSKALEGVAARFDEITAARQRYENSLAGGEKDDNFKAFADAWEKINEAYTNGDWNSNQAWASAELLFGEEQLEKWGWSDGLEEINNAIAETAKVFEDADSAGEGFLGRLADIAQEGKVLGEDGSVLAEIGEDGWFIDNGSIDEFAKKMGMSTEAVLACIQAVGKWQNVVFYDSEEVVNALKDVSFATDGITGVAANVELFTAQLEALGYNKADIHGIIKDLEEAEGVTFIGVSQSVDELTTSLVNLGAATDENGQITIDVENLGTLLSQMQFTRDEAEEVIKKLATIDSVTFAGLEGTLSSVEDALATLDGKEFSKVEKGADDAGDAVKDTVTYMERLETRVNRLNGKVVKITVKVETNDPNNLLTGNTTVKTNNDAAITTQTSNGSNRQTGEQDRLASGTTDARGGPSLTGEEGPEMVLHRGSAYIAGTNGPEIVNLDKGDTVYTAEETKDILRRRDSARNELPAFAKGTSISRISVSNSTSGEAAKTSTDYAYSSDEISEWSEDVEEATEAAESEFERLYKYHQHLRNMDAESMAEYLEWLNDAYEEAYYYNEIELDDFYKYQEEVYEGYKDLFNDYLSDIEHEIDMRSFFDGESIHILTLYTKLIEDIEHEIQDARARGLDDTDDYVQELQQKWKTYHEAARDIMTEAEENAESAVKKLIDYRIDMLKQDVSNEKDAIDKKLEYLREFYRKQKEMLQDQYDEEDYLEQQDEKRKAVAAVQEKLTQLERDDSAWAGKRRMELLQELADKQKDLVDFERDHARKLTEDALDDELERNEKTLEAKKDALDEEISSAKELYERALADIRNGSVELYEEMIRWNDQYGDGISETITVAWEDAYKALNEYWDAYREYYKDIHLSNATGYEPYWGSWKNSPIYGGGYYDYIDGYDSGQDHYSGDTGYSNGGYGTDADNVVMRSVAAAIWNGNYGWGSGQDRLDKLDEVFGENNGIQDLVEQGVGMYDPAPDDEYSYYNMRRIMRGYSQGTDYATRGLHKIDEAGTETIFESANGTRYKMFTGGEMVLNAKASNFLYGFANSGYEVLSKMVKGAVGGLVNNLFKGEAGNEIHMGDIIINGNADKQTVSEIRRAQRESTETMLKALNKLNRAY